MLLYKDFVKIVTVSKMNPLTFLAEVQDEIKRVVWPSRETVVRLTGVVVIVAIITGVFVGGVDFLFTNVVNFLLSL